MADGGIEQINLIPRTAWPGATSTTTLRSQRYAPQSDIATHAAHAPASPFPDALQKGSRRFNCWGPGVQGSRR